MPEEKSTNSEDSGCLPTSFTKEKKGKDVAGMNLAQCNPRLQPFPFIN